MSRGNNGLFGEKLDEFVALYSTVPEVANAWNTFFRENYPNKVEVAELHISDEFAYLGATVLGSNPNEWCAEVRYDVDGVMFWQRLWGIPLNEVAELHECSDGICAIRQ